MVGVHKKGYHYEKKLAEILDGFCFKLPVSGVYSHGVDVIQFVREKVNFFSVKSTKSREIYLKNESEKIIVAADEMKKKSFIHFTFLIAVFFKGSGVLFIPVYDSRIGVKNIIKKASLDEVKTEKGTLSIKKIKHLEGLNIMLKKEVKDCIMFKY